MVSRNLHYFKFRNSTMKKKLGLLVEYGQIH